MRSAVGGRGGANRIALVTEAEVGRGGSPPRCRPLPPVGGARDCWSKKDEYFTSASGATTVPMSRPSMTTLPWWPSSRWRSRHDLTGPRGARRGGGRCGRCSIGGSRMVTWDPGNGDGAGSWKVDRIRGGELSERLAVPERKAALPSQARSTRGTWPRYRGSGSRAARRVAVRPCSSLPLRGRLWRQSSSGNRVEEVQKPGEAYSDCIGALGSASRTAGNDACDRAEHRDAVVSIRQVGRVGTPSPRNHHSTN